MAEHASFIRPDQFWRALGLRAGQTVVHLGVGAGFYLIPAAKIVGKSGKAIGIDLLTGLLAEAEGRAAREGLADTVHTIRANLETKNGSTLPDASADWVLTANILHQSDPALIMLEAARIVRPAGNVVVVEWDTAETPLGPPVERRLAQPDAVQHATAAGLRVVNSWQPSPYHYGLVLQKVKS